jgi:UPF0755 protein
LNPKNDKIGWILIVIGACVIITVAFLGLQLYGVPDKVSFSEPIEVEVPRGASLSLISDLFVDAGLVDSKWKLKTAARITRLDRRLRAGRYTFKKPLSPVDIVKRLTVGGAFDVTVTFPEGYTVFDIARLAQDSLKISADSILALCFRESFLESLGIPAPSCEGYLFPETYRVPEGLSAEGLIKLMFLHFQKVWTADLDSRAKEIGLKMNEVITLASIIEGEAHVAWEQPVISSVYHNRLRRGMLLQADPTVIYGLRIFDRKLTLADLDTSTTPYNSYRFSGLPPGAINNPGRSAIEAALWPDSSDYLFFVSNEDGTHWFNTELQGHYNAIRAIRSHGKQGPLPKVYNRNILSNK